ncbi:AbrB/MazE/SpoVT family DNA-binding domain-containing protein [Klenkia sp. LSe6-5]|uniref:AbrB/MazE/SpoVT family DNA-binding domain-containing protein n=1 Tax=Klenkia sesuvii TaxID=3103137 RepID=A0ABU8DXY9_9ACTN
MGDRGRLVVPSAIRDRLDWRVGSRLVVLEHEDGIELISRDALLARVQADFGRGPSLVDELVADRRAEAERDLAG